MRQLLASNSIDVLNAYSAKQDNLLEWWIFHRKTSKSYTINRV